ncbi:MAG: hypothetical protein LBS19_01990, partial [Clostridiales bacterium]|nr:hypothetical protein [Clostridiales bacterium]
MSGRMNPHNSRASGASRRPTPERGTKRRGSSPAQTGSRSLKNSLLTVFFSAVISILTGIRNIGAKVIGFITSLDRRTKIAAVAGVGFFVLFVIIVAIILGISRPNALEVYIGDEIIGIV